jgi:zinc protease
MRLPHALCSLALAVSAQSAPHASAADRPAGVVDIPYERFVLANGLTLIVHEDHKAPIVAVNVWYDVGSADEKRGKTGFAHLFEHLMFNGSENFDDDYMKPFDRVGATGMNGTTNFDRTNYFQVVPKTALDMALWMESDRMGHLLGAIDQAKLDEQRGVVQNEKRQGENQPYGKAFITIFENTYPEGHPYAHSVIGSMEDLDAASLEDVKEWFGRYYGAANAVLAVAGDVEAEDVEGRVERYFGDIASGPALVKPDVVVARRSEETRHVMWDRVPQGRVYKAFNVAALGDPAIEYLDMVSDVLTSGKSSRLHKRLVYDDQIATDAVSFVFGRELGSLFLIWATALPGQDLAAVEAALDEELRRLLDEGPTPEELERSRAEQRAGFIRGIERIGGFGGKSDILASNQVYLGSPDAHLDRQTRILGASAEDVSGAARDWLSGGAFTLEVRPFPEYAARESDVDRSQGVPQVAEFPAGAFPAREETTLDGGLEVILAQRDAVPVVELSLLVDAGSAADHFGTEGTARLAMDVLDEGTASRSALEISDELQRLGATLGTGNSLDLSLVTLSALKENLQESLDLYADVILNPSFPEAELERLRKQQLARIQQEKVQPFPMALRVFPRLLFGEGHPYGMSFTGSGTEESVASLSLDDVRGFHSTWFKPGNATLVVVGDVSMDELRPMLAKSFAGWQPGEVPRKELATVEHRPGSVVYLIDRPDSEQSMILAGHVVPPKSDAENLALEAVNGILGGAFSARLNMNLREDKHWSYGARSAVVDTAAQRPFLAYAPVQTDKTKESLAELHRELTEIRDAAARPPTDEELAKVKDQQTLTLPGRWETNDAVLGDIVELVRFGLPEDHWTTYPARVRALGLEQVRAEATDCLRPGQTVWVVVGDRARIEDGIRELNLGEIHLLDADGRVLAP